MILNLKWLVKLNTIVLSHKNVKESIICIICIIICMRIGAFSYSSSKSVVTLLWVDTL